MTRQDGPIGSISGDERFNATKVDQRVATKQGSETDRVDDIKEKKKKRVILPKVKSQPIVQANG